MSFFERNSTSFKSPEAKCLGRKKAQRMANLGSRKCAGMPRVGHLNQNFAIPRNESFRGQNWANQSLDASSIDSARPPLHCTDRLFLVALHDSLPHCRPPSRSIYFCRARRRREMATTNRLIAAPAVHLQGPYLHHLSDFARDPAEMRWGSRDKKCLITCEEG